MQCRLSWGDLGVDCADSYMPVLLGNYLLLHCLALCSVDGHTGTTDVDFVFSVAVPAP